MNAISKQSKDELVENAKACAMQGNESMVNKLINELDNRGGYRNARY